MATIERVPVCGVDDCPPGTRKEVRFNGRSIVCLNIDGEYFAVSGKCPHQGASLYFADVCGRMLPSDPHEYVYASEDPMLRCPWHGWQFDVKTGASAFDPRTGIATYTVELVDGVIQILVPVLSGGVVVSSCP